MANGDINEVSEAIGSLKTEVKHLSEAVGKLNSHVENLNKSKTYSLGFMGGISAAISGIIFVVGSYLKGH